MELGVHLDTTYLLKTENWKHCSKIIFKCVNSAIEPIFNESFVEKRDLWVLWTMHGTHWQTQILLVKEIVGYVHSARDPLTDKLPRETASQFKLKKKKKKRKKKGKRKHKRTNQKCESKRILGIWFWAFFLQFVVAICIWCYFTN